MEFRHIKVTTYVISEDNVQGIFLNRNINNQLYFL